MPGRCRNGRIVVRGRRAILSGAETPQGACCSEGVDRAARALRQPQRRRDSPRPKAAGKKPNILVIFGDDIGQTNVSAYSHGPDGLSHAEHRPHRQGRA